MKDEYNNNTKVRNPNFPENYINHIIENIGKVDFIFISSHKNVRDALSKEGLKYILFYPEKSCKQEWIQRAINRGSPESFANMLDTNWDSFIDELHNIESKNVIKQEIGNGEYITKKYLDTFYQYSKFFKARKV